MKNIVIFAFALVLLMSSCETIVLTLVDEKPVASIVNGDKAYLNGVLGKRAHKRLIATLDEHPEVTTIVLQELPGSVNDEWNVKTCVEIRERGINTYIEESSVIQSGAVDLFIAGVKRFAESGAQVGVHSWRSGKKEGKDYPADSEEHDIFVEYFKAIDRDTSFYWFTLIKAPADSMYFMSREELDEYEVVTDWVE